MKVKLEEEVEIPEGVQVTVDKEMIVKGPKGEVKKNMFYPGIVYKLEGNKIKLSCKSATRREKKILYSNKAHLANMMKGVITPWVYKLKICAGHFPMSVNIAGKELIIKNFLGEKVPRKMKIKDGAKVNIDGKDITVESIDKEIAGNVASEIELLTAVSGRDRRIFQDGIYIIEKAGKPLK